MTDALLASLDEAFDKRSWHGTNLRGSIRGLTWEQAAARPARGRHNTWELGVHCAYWKYAVRRRLTGEKRGSFPLEGSNFWVRPEATVGRHVGRNFSSAAAAAWKRDVALLSAQHKALRAAVAAFPAKRWSARAPGSPFTYLALVRGAAAHDLYHAGQIQLVKRLNS